MASELSGLSLRNPSQSIISGISGNISIQGF